MIEIASGVFGWDALERRSGRYGAFHLTDAPFSNGPAKRCATPWFDWQKIEPLIGQRVRLQCRVLEARASEHVGDLFLGVYPSTPEVGAVLDLGVGFFGAVEHVSPDIIRCFSLRPGDGRSQLWIDPEVLYQLHSQTVSLLAEVTTDDFTPAPKHAPLVDGAISTGDNGFQVRGIDPEALIGKIPMGIEPLDDGFYVNVCPPAGKRAL